VSPDANSGWVEDNGQWLWVDLIGEKVFDAATLPEHVREPGMSGSSCLIRTRPAHDPGPLVSEVRGLIHLVRGERVLLDADLAKLYGVTTGNLNKAVKRNLRRFPADFIFRLTRQEDRALLFQSGRSNARGGRRHQPYAFTERGVAMLSSVLRSERAIEVNVAIMRAFVNLRRMLASSEALGRKLAELERRLAGHDQVIKSLFAAIRELMALPPKAGRQIGFRAADPRR
jgi:hypothetical protein